MALAPSSFRSARRRAVGSLGLALAACVAFAACGGQEDVQLAPFGAGLDAASEGAEPDAPDTTITDEGGSDATAGDGARSCDNPSRVCVANGAKCSDNADCCSSRCAQGTCLQAGTCAGPGTPCTSRASCCSGLCEVVGSTRQCLDYCRPDGDPCTLASDCCSLACNNGTCGGKLCTSDDALCTTNAQCCSGNCDPVLGRCRFGGASCAGTGVECSTSCCSGVCVTPTGGGDSRCDLGPGPCRPPGAICNTAADCCRGTCTLGAGGFSYCTAPCLADGQACGSAGDCCGKVCVGSPAVCASAVPQCKLIGTACGGDGECCSGQCPNGFCGNSCPLK